MPENTVEKSPFLERVPELRNRKWAGMEPAEAAKVVAEILQEGKPAMLQLIEGLREVDNGTDWKERLLIHQLATQCSVPERAKERALLTDVLAEAALSERPSTVRSFLLQQVRLIADASAAARLEPLLKDPDPLMLDAVTAVMVSIGEGARKTLQDALPAAEGHAKEAIDHALNQIG